MIPPKESTSFLWKMERVLDLYATPYDAQYPVICFDEKPYQLLAEVYPLLKMKPGRSQRHDYEYERRGMCSLLLFFEPLSG